MTNSTGAFRQAITLKAIQEAVERAARSKHEKLERWMTAQGFDPARGGRLVLPEKERERFLLPPSYVKFSSIVERPILFIEPRLW